LMDDNFSTIVDTIKDGRRIYDNIKKAVGYVFTIHIPIALSSLLAPALGFGSDGLLFLPLHVVLLELIIDPTCSVVLERQPAEPDIMERKPRNPRESLVSARLVLKSAAQGLSIFAASFGAYFFMSQKNPGDAALARSMGISAIMLCNLFLIQVNGSDTKSVAYTTRRLARDKAFWIVNAATAALIFVFLYSPANAFLRLSPLSPAQLLAVLAISAASTLWYEIVKALKRRRAIR
ncbi:MAG: cation-translocating P-type ATPase, partial [Defluviitaleaceae bacterium]|nr:cation-translocating P-type ATPase [Defluviitaleaceae bacterium]